MPDEQLIKDADIQEIANAGSKIYESIQYQFEADQHGKFLAIDTTSKDFFLGDTSSEAVEKARIIHPNTVFYVV